MSEFPVPAVTRFDPVSCTKDFKLSQEIPAGSIIRVTVKDGVITVELVTDDFES